jgi:uncharacterized membrane protein YhaH (DUF805 family)
MFKNSFSFEGRIRRSEYCLSFLIYAVIAGIVNTIVEESEGDAAFLMIAFIPLLWFIIAQAAKRCHDVGNSGWWQLIPFYGLWLIFQDGEIGANKYGENPKGIQVIGGQSTQSSQNTGTSGSGYQGGYNGGHNNPNTNYFSSENPSKTEGYKDGDLYK